MDEVNAWSLYDIDFMWYFLFSCLMGKIDIKDAYLSCQTGSVSRKYG
ncbi:hypothetical protein ECP02994385_2294 [Escherichia coli P0299438.5]|nr:hypothetical protein ECP029943811_2284 [Escherichia coli P0299438.11]ENB99274.1 hypothetical protein ECP02994383_2350 [Escherichia coli P0299438.3]ENC10874.1 hypothetical protein ECP02994385_2294 [Escherichia coli P0299438.5]ENC16011.1 hypothetical protein ECP02994386_2285 [Escherichia coli P0299438.6]ENC18240.1 hypothetical protein ECP02994387_2322 [Escherichia coli P0299438.7]ENC24648.1 hypothetical protein ECP02994388_2350 [Escherichia coli P0299438.8]